MRGTTLVAVGYARISKDDTAEGRGVARQTEDVETVCARHGWQLDRMLVDNDISASRFSRQERPGYEQLLALLSSGRIDRAVVYDLDRLLRQPRQLEDLIDLVEQHPSVELHTVTGRIDLTTAAGRFTARAMVAVAAMEGDNASRRLRRAFEQKAKDGRPHGPRPFGYEPDGITPREQEADLIRLAANDILNGASLSSVARGWTRLGVPTPQGGAAWNSTTVRSVLTNPRQIGDRYYRGELVKKDAWPANLDRDTHRRLVTMLDRPIGRRPAMRSNPFGGLITDVNGVPLDRDVVKGRPTYRGRKRPGRAAELVSIAALPLERFVLLAVDEALDGGLLATRLQQRADQEQHVPDLAALEREVELLAADFGEGMISRAEWLAAREPLLRRIEAGRRTVLEAHAQDALDQAAQLRQQWATLGVHAQAKVLRAVLESVRIHPAGRTGPQPIAPGLGRIDLDRVELRWIV